MQIKRDGLFLLVPFIYGLICGWISSSFGEFSQYCCLVSLVLGIPGAFVLFHLNHKDNPEATLSVPDRIVLGTVPLLFGLIFSHIFGGILYFIKSLRF